jgi:hypothetical protein
METLKKYGLFGLIAIAGILIGRYVIQPKSEVRTKEVVKYVNVYKEKKEEKKKIKTTITEVINKDGTKTVTTVITDDSTSSSENNNEIKVDSNKETIAKKGSGLTLGALAIANGQRFSDKLEYGVTAAIPVFGSLKAQALVTTDKRVGLGLAIEF